MDGPSKISADLISVASVIKFLVAGCRGHSLILLSHRAVGASRQSEREDGAPTEQDATFPPRCRSMKTLIFYDSGSGCVQATSPLFCFFLQLLLSSCDKLLWEQLLIFISQIPFYLRVMTDNQIGF